MRASWFLRQVLVVLVLVLVTGGSFLAVKSTAPVAKKTTAAKAVAHAPVKKKVVVVKKKTAVAPKATLTSAPVQNSSTDPQLTASAGTLLHSLVNIICVSSVPSIPSISGSGVVVDSRGIVLTAAHVAQLFLLQDSLGKDKVSCVLRTGSPARRAYTAEPIYVSPTWVAANPATLATKDPLGTGQDDFAFLAITGTATSTPLPSTFTYVPLASADAQTDDSVAIGSYGAEYLSANDLNYSLFPLLTYDTIHDRFTFGAGTPDLISIVGSAASQEGSSGGGLVNTKGELIGAVTTSSTSGDFAKRVLNAVTVNYMRNSYKADTGRDLDQTLKSESLSQLVSDFSSEAQQLAQKLVLKTS